MRAIITSSSIDAEVQLVRLPEPRPGPGQIRIRMAGAAVNAVDLHIIDGGREDLAGRRLGTGFDVAGVIDLVGPGVGDFVAGDRVAALHLPYLSQSTAGTAAEFVVVPAVHAAQVPDGVDLLDAATVPLNGLTAAQLLGLLGPARGRSLLVTGAAGGVGGYAVALAARAGWRVTGLARAEDGAFLARAKAAMVTSIDEITGFDAVFDAAMLNDRALRAVRDGGFYVGVVPGKEPLPGRGITSASAVVAPDGVLLRRLLELTARGVLEPRRAATFRLSDAARAYRAFRAGGQRGRLVLIP